jgi:hypothetical protein
MPPLELSPLETPFGWSLFARDVMIAQGDQALEENQGNVALRIQTNGDSQQLGIYAVGSYENNFIGHLIFKHNNYIIQWNDRMEVSLSASRTDENYQSFSNHQTWMFDVTSENKVRFYPGINNNLALTAVNGRLALRNRITSGDDSSPWFTVMPPRPMPQ